MTTATFWEFCRQESYKAAARGKLKGLREDSFKGVEKNPSMGLQAARDDLGEQERGRT